MTNAAEFRFLYAGGHPDIQSVPKSGSTKVFVTDTEVSYRRKGIFGGGGWQTVFSIEPMEIVEVRQTSHASGAGAGGNDQFIEVDIQHNGVKFVIRFKAIGMSQQKDAFSLYSALNTLRAKARAMSDGELKSGVSPTGPGSNPDDTLERLERLAVLKAQGILSEEEFIKQKDRIIFGKS
jgi:hypothetical protein